MASKYDKYWLSQMDIIRDAIFEYINKGTHKKIVFEDLDSQGHRPKAGWYALIYLGKTGYHDPIYAHAISLAKLLTKQSFYDEIFSGNRNNLKLRLKISNDLIFTIQKV